MEEGKENIGSVLSQGTEGATHKGMCLSLCIFLHLKLLAKKHKQKMIWRTIKCTGEAKIYM